MGVATVGVLYATVRRWFSPAAGLLAGAVLALTPGRRADVPLQQPRRTARPAPRRRRLRDDPRPRGRAARGGWCSPASLVGFGFLTKMLQAFLVVPAFGLVYLIAAPTSPARGGSGSCVVAGVAHARRRRLVGRDRRAVARVASRPYIGGSQNNSVLNLIFGYNGFGRLTGNETGSVGGGGGQAGGTVGPDRLAAHVQHRVRRPDLVAAPRRAHPARRRARADAAGGHAPTARRAAFILWGGWLLVTGVVFSLGKGIIHPYYTVALAPAIGALVGIGAGDAVEARQDVARGAVARGCPRRDVGLVVRAARPHPQLEPVAARSVCCWPGSASPVALLAAHLVHGRTAVVLAIAAIVARPRRAGRPTRSRPCAPRARGAHPRRRAGRAPAAFGRPGGGRCQAGGRSPVADGSRPAAPDGSGPHRYGSSPTGQAGAAQAAARRRDRRRGVGGLLNGSTPSAALITLLDADAELVHVGGGHDRRQPGRRLPAGHGRPGHGHRRLQRHRPDADARPVPAVRGATARSTTSSAVAGVVVAAASAGTSSTSTAISSWVTANFTATTVGGVTVYDLTTATG